MGVQTIISPTGEEMIVLSKVEYLKLLALAGNEDAEDELDGLLAEERRKEQPLSAAVSAAVLDGLPLDDAIATFDR
jgi:hypothetical protein